MAISDPEKTVIDCIDWPDLAGGPAELARIVHAAMAEIDQSKLVATALRMKFSSMLQRLGFLTDLVERPLNEALRTRLRDAVPKSMRSTFGRRERKDGDVATLQSGDCSSMPAARSLVRSLPHQACRVTIVLTIEQIRKVALRVAFRRRRWVRTDTDRSGTRRAPASFRVEPIHCKPTM